MCGWQVKLCDPLVTRGPYLSALEIRSLYIKRYINSPSLLYFTFTTYSQRRDCSIEHLFGRFCLHLYLLCHSCITVTKPCSDWHLSSTQIQEFSTCTDKNTFFIIHNFFFLFFNLTNARMYGNTCIPSFNFQVREGARCLFGCSYLNSGHGGGAIKPRLLG